MLQIEGAETICGAKHTKYQEQGNFLYGFKYILEISGGPCLEEINVVVNCF